MAHGSDRIAALQVAPGLHALRAGCAIGFFLAVGPLALAAAGPPPGAARPPLARDAIERAAVPPDGSIVLRDPGLKDWGPELVHYSLDASTFVPGRLVLTDATGEAVPFQIEEGVLAFVASLAKGTTATYALRASDRDRSADGTTLFHERRGPALEVGNERFSLRLAAPGRKEHSPPVPAAEVPPPILQWKQAGRDWIGAARFVTELTVASVESSVVRDGPACFEHETRYRFAPAGELVCRVRVIPGAPLALVVDELDAGRITEGKDLLVLDLHAGWTPDVFARGVATGEERKALPLEEHPFEAYMASRRGGKPAPAPVGGQGEEPGPFRFDARLDYVDRVIPGYGATSFAAMGAAGPGIRRGVGIVPLHVGSWRRAMQLTAWHQEGVGIRVALPVTARRIRWPLEITDDQSPFSTHEHDPDLSPTYARRVWGLWFGAGLESAQNRFGHIGLDRYKDWTVDWPEAADGGKPRFAYPRAFFTPELAARLRASLPRHPAREVLGTYYIITGRPEHAVAHARAVIDGLRGDPTGNWSAVGLTHYRQAQFLAFANQADDALACPDLPPELRRELRTWLAIQANLLSEPDVNPRGAGVHLGNNNMTFNRTLALPYFAGLLPDHPRHAYWMDQMAEWLRFKLATQTSVDGPFIECPSYQVYGPARYYNTAIHILRNSGRDDGALVPHLTKTLGYLANLTMPDARFGGRIIPGMGNSSNLRENFFGLCMATVEGRDPEFAGFLGYLHGLMSREERWEVRDAGYDFYWLPDVPPRPRELTTTFLPTYGVMFRDGFGTPGETALLFRAGMNWSHWDTDALNVILYGKGAPLSPGTGYQYYSGPATAENAVYHNQVKVARRDLLEVFGRVDGTIVDWGFGREADYAVAERYYPPELLADGKGAMRWRRHILFLKDDRPEGTDYFVVRDTFPNGAGRPSWWTWLNLDTADRIRVDGVAFDASKSPVEKVVPPAEMPVLTGRVIEMDTAQGAGTRFWFTRPHETRIRLTFQAAGETKTIVEAAAPGGEDWFYVVWPQRPGERPPAIEAVSPDCLRIDTGRSVDWVFVADAPTWLDRDEILFEGRAGAVRVYSDRVALSYASGSGRIGYRGRVFEGFGPFERTVAVGDLAERDLEPGAVRVEGGYEKRIHTQSLGDGIGVAGEAPFVATLEDRTIRIRTLGRARVLHVTRPSWMLRPQHWIDGVEHMACWTDYPASYWGRMSNTNLVGLSVPEGEHELVLRDLVFPPVWTRQFEPRIGAAVPDPQR